MLEKLRGKGTVLSDLLPVFDDIGIFETDLFCARRAGPAAKAFKA
jgi:hypothetical protein